MRFKILYSTRFFEDLQQDIDWYNDKQPGLGVRFYKAVKSRLAEIKRNPYSVAIRYDDVRYACVKKFPYMIHFRVLAKDNIIEAIAVFSTHRNPEIWKSLN
jgi:hypothetical protein